MKIYWSIVFSFCLTSVVSAQDSLFARVYYNLGADLDVYTAARAFDGGIVMAGNLIMKVDSLGNTLWKRSLSYGNYTSIFTDVMATTDSNYVAAGYGYNQGEGKELTLVLKLNSNGDTLWTRQLGVAGQAWTYRACLTEGIDSSYLIAWTNSGENRSFLAKMDQNGNLLMNKIVTGSKLIPYEIKQLNDSSIYMLGTDNGSNGNLLKFNSNADLLWNKSYASASFEDWEFVGDSLYVALLDQNNYAKGLALFDTSGTLNWTNIFVGGYQDWMQHAKINMCMLNDTSFVMQSPSQMIWNNPVIRCDKDGNLLGNKQVEMAGMDVLPADHNGVYLIGVGPLFGIKNFTMKHIGIVRADTNLISVNCTIDNGMQTSQLSSLTEIPLTLSTSNGINTYQNNFIVNEPDHSDFVGCVSAFGSVSELEDLKMLTYPNPTDHSLTIELTDVGFFTYKLIDLFGNVVMRGSFSGDVYSMNICALANGTYLLEVSESTGLKFNRTKVQIMR